MGMNQVFAWFGANPVYYHLIALTALFLFVTLAVRNRQAADGRRVELVFLAMTFVTLFACRWPVFLAPFPLNPDESTFATGAIKATVDFAPWRGFNAGTSGPLNVYILALPALFGAPITFASCRIIAALLMGTAMLALYYAVKWTYGDQVARLSIVPPVLFLSLVTDWDFVHYSSELLSICLTTIALAGISHLTKEGGSLSSHVTAGAIAGFCLGSTLFAKFQAVPIALLLFTFAAATVLLFRSRVRKEVWVVAMTTVGAMCVVPAAILTSLWWTGEFRDAYWSYIRMNLGYAAAGVQKLRLAFFLEYSAYYTVFLVCSLIIILLSTLALARRRMFTRQAVCVAVASFLLLSAALFVIIKPHREFGHYLLFSIVPVSFFVANALGLTRAAGFWKGRGSFISILLVALFVLPTLSVAMSSGNRFIKELAYNLKHRKSAAALAISRYAKPGDPMCVWGWASEYHVQTSTYPATRELETEGFIREGPYNRFRQRYLSEIQKSKPVVFVDAVAPNEFFSKDRATQGHEIFPELAAYIRDNYELKEEISGVRIYVRTR